MLKKFAQSARKIAVNFAIFFAELLSNVLIWLGERSRFEIFLILIGVVWIFSSSLQKETSNRASVSPVAKVQKTDGEIRMEMQWNLDALKIRAVKQSMKNPNSFDLVDVTKMDDGSLCVTYRGTNSFNAITTEHVVILSNAQIGSWSKSCAGKSGSDLTRIKYAI